MRFWYALTFLQESDMEAAEEVLYDAADEQTHLQAPNAFALLLEEWCHMCRSPSMEDYFASARQAQNLSRDEHPLDLLASFAGEFAPY